MQYDIAIIGNDEGAFEMLALAARVGGRTAAVLPESCQSSWMVGLALKQLVSDLLVDLSLPRRRLLERIGSPRLLRQLLAAAVARETAEHIANLEQLDVDISMGEPQFVDRHTLAVADTRSGECRTLKARHFVIGTGVRRTSMHRSPSPRTRQHTDSLFVRTVIPESLCVVGGGSFGCGMAALFSLFGVRVRHVTKNNQDDALMELAREAGVEIAFHPAEFGLTHTDGVLSAKHSDIVDYRRAEGFTDHLNLQAIDVLPDENGQLWCSSRLETWCAGVFGIGKVVGFSPETALPPSVQAEKIQRCISRLIPRPHLLDVIQGPDQRVVGDQLSTGIFVNH